MEASVKWRKIVPTSRDRTNLSGVLLRLLLLVHSRANDCRAEHSRATERNPRAIACTKASSPRVALAMCDRVKLHRSNSPIGSLTCSNCSRTLNFFSHFPFFLFIFKLPYTYLYHFICIYLHLLLLLIVFHPIALSTNEWMTTQDCRFLRQLVFISVFSWKMLALFRHQQLFFNEIDESRWDEDKETETRDERRLTSRSLSGCCNVPRTTRRNAAIK